MMSGISGTCWWIRLRWSNFASASVAASATPSSASPAPGRVSCWLVIASKRASTIGAGLRALRFLAHVMVRLRPSRRSFVGPP